MKKEIQTLVAMQLLALKDNVITHSYINNKIVEENSLSVLQALKLATEEGLNIMLPLEESQLNSYGYLTATNGNGKITFIEKMMSKHMMEKDIIMFLYDKLESKDLKQAHPQFAKNIYSMLYDNGISMRKMFEIGFDFTQGKFDEESKAVSGDVDFFECCLCFKQDFDFKYKYEDEYTLKQAVEGELEYLQSNKNNTDKAEQLLNFIEKATVKQSLDNKTSENLIKESKMKI